MRAVVCVSNIFKKHLMTLTISFLLLMMFSFNSNAENAGSFVIKGLERVEHSTILSYLDIKKGKKITQNLIDSSIKNLYSTNLFADINISSSNGVVTIKIIENPIVNSLYLEGNRRIKDKTILPLLSLKSRSIFTKSKLQQDTKKIISTYNRQGRYSANVIPKIIKKNNNRVDIVYEIDEGPKTPIKKITFVGNHSVGDNELKSNLISKEEGFFSFLTGSGRYDPDMVEFDKERLRNFYFSIGHANFKLLSAFTEFSPNKDAAYVTFNIEEGNTYKYGNVKIINHMNNIDLSKLYEIVKAKKGKVFDGDQNTKDIDALTKEFNNMGYAFVNINSNKSLNKKAKTVDLNYEIFETTKFYVGKINIHGNVRTHDKVIRRQFRLDEGDPFNATKSQRSEQRLRNLDYFANVKMSNTKSVEHHDRVDINAEVEEKSTSHIKFGVGYASNEGAIGSISFAESNMFGTGRSFNAGVEKGAKKLDLSAGIYDPYFMDSRFGLGISANFNKANKREFSPYNRRVNGFSIRTKYGINEYLSHEIKYSLQNSNIDNVEDKASRFIKEQAGKRLTSKIGHYLKYDRRDGRFKTSEGYYINIAQEFAGLGGNVKFIKHTIDGKYYFPISKKNDVIFKVSGSVRHVKGVKGNDLTINEHFFSGGEDLRGFEVAGIGPRDKEIGSNNIHGDALGGNLYYKSTAELNFPLGLPKEYDIYGLLFCDAASLTNLNLRESHQGEVHNDRKIRSSVGFGVVWLTQAGIVNLSWGYPILKEEYDVTNRFLFNFTTDL